MLRKICARRCPLLCGASEAIFSLLFLNFYHEPFLGFWVFRVSKINPKQKMSRLSLLSFVVLHTSSSALFCSVAAVLLSLSFSLSSLSSLSQSLALGVGVVLWWPPARLFLEEV